MTLAVTDGGAVYSYSLAEDSDLVGQQAHLALYEADFEYFTMEDVQPLVTHVSFTLAAGEHSVFLPFDTSALAPDCNYQVDAGTGEPFAQINPDYYFTPGGPELLQSYNGRFETCQVPPTSTTTTAPPSTTTSTTVPEESTTSTTPSSTTTTEESSTTSPSPTSTPSTTEMVLSTPTTDAGLSSVTVLGEEAPATSTATVVRDSFPNTGFDAVDLGFAGGFVGALGLILAAVAHRIRRNRRPVPTTMG